MTSSNGLKSAVSKKRLQAIAQPLTVSTRKPSIKKVSLLRGRLLAKPFLNGSLNVQPTEKATTFQSGGGCYDYKRISALHLYLAITLCFFTGTFFGSLMYWIQYTGV